MTRIPRISTLLAAAAVWVPSACAPPALPPPSTQIMLETAPVGADALRADSDALPPRAQEPGAPESDGLPALGVERRADPLADVQRVEVFATAGDTDVRAVLRELAHGLGLDYRIAPEVTGTVNLRMQDATLDEVLRAVVLPLGYEYQLQDRVLVVGPAEAEQRVFLLDYVALSRVGQGSTVVQRRISGSGGGGSDFISTSSVADLWSDIRVALEAIVFGTPEAVFIPADADSTGAVIPQAPDPDLRVAGSGSGNAGNPGNRGGGGGASAYSRVQGGRSLIINPMAGTIHVTAVPDILDRVDAYVDLFESSVQRQVLIEAKIVEVRLDQSYEYGIDWSAVQTLGNVTLRMGTGGGTGEGGLQFMLDGGNTQITAVLQSLEQQGDVRVLSSPQVSALNNQRAIFNVTTDEVIFSVNRQPITGPNGGTIGFTNEIQTDQVAVGIVLDVHPMIGSDNTVSMSIRPAITSVARTEVIRTPDGTEARAPVIDRREIDTFARVRPGETIVIGGLMQTRRERHHSGIPFLKDIPVLGALFGRVSERETRGELVIFITPTIVAGQLEAGR